LLFAGNRGGVNSPTQRPEKRARATAVAVALSAVKGAPL